MLASPSPVADFEAFSSSQPVGQIYQDLAQSHAVAKIQVQA